MVKNIDKKNIKIRNLAAKGTVLIPILGTEKKIKTRKKLSLSVEEIIKGFKTLPYTSANTPSLYALSIRITQNNIFCYIGNVFNNITVLKLSSGNVKINITKKTIKFHSKRIIIYFLSLLPPKIVNTIVCVNFVLPKSLKRKIYFLVLSKFKKLRKKKKFFFKLFFFNGKKCFNGCRVSKLKRKKRHRYRILK